MWVIIATIVFLVQWSSCKGAYLDVPIDQGIVRGYDHDNDQVFSFFGIPYATVPEGVNKFRDNLPPPTWTTIFNATDNNTVCLQQPFNSDGIYKLNRKLDCLNINVFTPKTNATNLPVLVNIHGGAMVNGYGMKLSPIGLVESGIVAVTFNYRLGILGFMCLGTEMVPGNAAMKDQVAALKWVQRNIHFFGGDPSRVTIAGCSSASANVEHLILSPLSQGLFHQAITESGSAILTKLGALDHLKNAINQASSMGAKLKTIEDVERFYTNRGDEIFNSKVTTNGFIPCVETHNVSGVKKFFSDEPIDILVRGDYNKVSMITGFAPKEGQHQMQHFDKWNKEMVENLSNFLPNSVYLREREELMKNIQKIKDFYFSTGEITKMGYIDYFSDSYFIYPQYLFTRLNSRNINKKADIFLYLFNFRGTVGLPDVDKSIGLGHTPETLYVLDYDVRNIYSNLTEADRMMRRKLRHYYLNFLKYGSPNVNRPAERTLWVPFTEEKYFYLDIDHTDTLRQRPLRERFQLWDTIYDKQFNLTEQKSTLIIKREPILLILISVAILIVLLVVGSWHYFPSLFVKKINSQFTIIPVNRSDRLKSECLLQYSFK